MSSRQSPKGAALFGMIMLAVLVGGFSLMGNQQSGQGGATTAIAPEGIPHDTIPEESTANLSVETLTVPRTLLLKSTATGAEIVARKQGQNDQTLFSDTDEAIKLQQVIGLTTTHAFATVTTDTVGSISIAKISLDGSGSAQLVSDTLSASSAPALEPQRQRLAFISFNNAERDFGFILQTQTLNGQGVKTIDTSSTGLALPRWNTDGSRLAFVKGQATPFEGQVLRISNNEAEPTTVYTTEANTGITDLAWLGAEAIALVIEPLGNETQNQAKAMLLNLTTRALTTLIDATGKERGLAASPDGQFIGLVSGSVAAGPTTPEGIVTILKPSTSQLIELGNAQSVIGWTE